MSGKILLNNFFLMEVHISFKPETLFDLSSFSVSNSLFTALAVIIPLMVALVFLGKSFNVFKPGKLELLLETLYLLLFGLVENIMGLKYAKKFFPFLLTFFVFILFSNWFPLLPGVSSVGLVGEEEHSEQTAQDASVVYASSRIVNELDDTYTLDEEFVDPSLLRGGEIVEGEIVEEVVEEAVAEEEVVEENLGCLFSGKCYLTTSGITYGSFKHMFRAPTADLSAGIALALISVVVTNLVGFRINKLAYLSKYINFHGPVNFFVGILEIVSELGKVISFSFRLFGNIFAGEVLLVVITSISFGLATFPFLGLELFVGIIQALVFFMLTAVFINLAIEHKEH